MLNNTPMWIDSPLRTLREKLGLSIEEAANYIMVEVETLRRVETLPLGKGCKRARYEALMGRYAAIIAAAAETTISVTSNALFGAGDLQCEYLNNKYSRA